MTTTTMLANQLSLGRAKPLRNENAVLERTMTNALTPEDIRDLLTAFAAAIELDQLRVDAMPPEKFHPLYNDGMWRRWRRHHLDYISQLLPTVNAMPSVMLEELTRIAIAYEPVGVRLVVLDLFADAASNSCPMEDLETATLFFGWCIKRITANPEDQVADGDPRTQLMRWLPANDPLRIALDPECGYGLPTGLVS